MRITDQLNRTLQLEIPPKRIISLVPSQTELLMDLGLDKQLVGITKFCVHPEGLKSNKTIVGGTKKVRYPKIKALKPDLILCNKEENTQEMIERLSEIAPVHISDIYDLQDSFELIASYGKIFKLESTALRIIDAIKQARRQFKLGAVPPNEKKVAYFIWKDPWMVAAGRTFINHMLAEAGYRNVFENKDRYPEIQLDDVQLQQVEVIFLSSEPFPFKKEHLQMIQHRFPKKKVMMVNGEMFSWYGSRLRLAYDYFRTLKEKSV